VVAEAAAPPAAPACAVTFTLAADDGQRFDAAITTAPAESLPAGWRLSLRLPPSPVRIDPGGGWDRRADVVTSAPQPAVAAGASATLTLAGSHDGAIALPTKIDVSGHPCDVVLLDASARPAPPVVTELALPAPVVAAAKAPKAPAPKAPKPAADKHKPGPAKDKR